MCRSPPFEEISSDRIFFCLCINSALWLINPSIVNSGVIDANGFCEIPVDNVIPVKQEVFIIGFRDFIRSAADIARTCGTELPEHVCFYRDQ